MPQALIDCDVHPLVRGGVEGLRPYLPRNGADEFGGDVAKRMHGATARPMNRYTNPSPGIVRGALRADAVPPSGEDPGSDPEFVVTDLLERWGAEAAMLIPLPYGVWADPLDGARLMSAMNAYYVDQWLPVDARFRLAAGIFALDAAAAAREVDKLAEKAQVASVFMPLLGMPMGHPHFDPVYAAASRAGLPIVVHPSGAEGSYPVAPALAGGLPATYVERHVALSQVAATNVASLVLNGTFDRFPELKVVFAEYGFSWVAPLMWRMDREAERLGAPRLKRHPVEYFLDHVRFCSQPIEEPARPSSLKQLIRMMRGEQTLMFSTDYPHWDTDNPERILGVLDADTRHRVFYENAKTTFAGRM
jgi:predicted TIM-barrel fold metal-dependent hydrolase